MIAQFPQFSNLEITHKKELESITTTFAPYSDFNFTSLFSWNTDDSTSISLLNGNLVIKLPDYISGEAVYSIIGNKLIDESLKKLLELAGSLKLVPEVTIKQIENQNHFKITEDSDNFDYVYELEKIAQLSGKKYKIIRNKLNSFNKNYSGHKTENVPKVKPNLILNIFDSWAKTARQSEEDSKSERVAISRLLYNMDCLDLLFTVILIDSGPVAFSINEVLSDNYAICHFEKALSGYKNLFASITNEAAKALLKEGCVLVNWEQDLGIEGLRKSKMSYRPQQLLKKYLVRLN